MYPEGILWIFRMFQQRDIKLDTREKKRDTREEIHENINLPNRKKYLILKRERVGILCIKQNTGNSLLL